MNVFLAAMLAAIPNALLAIGAKMFSDKFMQMVLEKILIFGMKKAASMTTNTVDNELADMVETRLKDGAI